MTSLLISIWYLALFAGMGYSAYGFIGHSMWAEPKAKYYLWAGAACSVTFILSLVTVSYFR